jgi:hypothetical protein
VIIVVQLSKAYFPFLDRFHPSSKVLDYSICGDLILTNHPFIVKDIKTMRTKAKGKASFK